MLPKGFFEVVEQLLLNTFFFKSAPSCLFWPPRGVFGCESHYQSVRTFAKYWWDGGLFIPNSKVFPDLDYRVKDHARYSTSVMIWIPVESWLRYATQAARRKVIDVHHCFHNELAYTMAKIFIFCLKTLLHSNLLKYDYQYTV